MTLRILSLCGMFSPVIYVFMTILGGALRPGYSHISDTVSELFSPGSPNKRLLDSLSTSTAVLNILFGVGVLTFPGQMHKILVGILALLSILSTLLLGIWLNGADIFPGFGTYSFVTVAIIILSGGFAAMKLGSPIMGLTERITVVVVLQWTFILGLRIFSIAV